MINWWDDMKRLSEFYVNLHLGIPAMVLAYLDVLKADECTVLIRDWTYIDYKA